MHLMVFESMFAPGEVTLLLLWHDRIALLYELQTESHWAKTRRRRGKRRVRYERLRNIVNGCETSNERRWRWNPKMC